MDRRQDKVPPRDESGADKAVVLMNDGDDVKSEPKLSADVEELRRAICQHSDLSAPRGIFPLPKLNLLNSSDLQWKMPAFFAPKIIPGGVTGPPLGSPPDPYNFFSIADMPGFQQQEFYHSDEKIAQLRGQGPGHDTKESSGLFSKLAKKCHRSERGPTSSSKSAQETSSCQQREKRNLRSQELSANYCQLQTVRQHLDKGDKVLIMMRGCPGSGKSTLASQLKFSGVILSTDDYFTKNGRYLFRKEKIGDAHQWNQKRALEKMKGGVNPIIIDNTNTQTWEMKPYVIQAQQS
ncbi:uncharacterized protein LOC135493188 isoform X3 [Lineus longissimus]|uniref:uncharacterized protein LOC135493188 isoform X3 n=1 Tax=Lineus longissimus TaxID=88925 RepID=UPI00315D6DAC